MPPRRNANRAAAPGPVPDGLNPDKFEKELRSLAKKAKSRTWATETRERLSPYISAFALLTLAGIYSNVSQMALSPIFGSLPSAVWHPKLIAAASFLGWAGSLFIERRLPVHPATLIPVIAIYVPVVQFFLCNQSSLLTATWGPLVIESITLAPITILTAACVASDLEGIRPGLLPKFIADSTPGLTSLLYFKVVESFSGRLLSQYVGRTIFVTRIGLEMLLAGIYAILAPSKLVLLGIPAIIHTTLFNYHLPTPSATLALQESLKAENWTLIDRRESVTGYISVLESDNQGFRVLRADHSLLGGEWVKFQGPQMAEPVYSVFVMLEAVRLVEGPQPIIDSEANALVIGLGIGTTPAAFITHGIDTTIVEIDPVVYEFASKYFQLPPSHTAVIDDAVSYTQTLARETDQRFDYIIHDVFTGGAEPLPLFTLEFLQGLNTLLKPDGVIAINYAGDILLPTPKMVIQTILHVFPSCRIFRESEAPTEEAIREAGQDFTNVVIFCKKSEDPLTFRNPVAGDFLQSRARDMFLVPKHETFLSEFRSEEDVGLLMNNGTAELEGGQETSAVGHWEVMRTVVPPKVWELW
ncbi:related to spermine/spermidine synthase family protein [Cephalotrichum gorgonifer]|uniref:Related to spermine/spermidine synthase family protein n=1 Tax=Cephalotrichum gorgonifer TaxID=2041049 RepID=A0AAE8SXP7_9PEZI|nr:related to spermine/spermidine synthase family protein [Cephalotrichum gorgonifer]